MTRDRARLRVVVPTLVAISSLLLAGQGLAQSESAWTIRSPYRALGKSRELLDAIGLRVLLGYQPTTTAAGGWRLTGRPGIEVSRGFTKTVGDDEVYTIELALASYPAGGYDIFLDGGYRVAGVASEHPDLYTIQSGIEQLVAAVQADQDLASATPLERKQLAFEPYQLSYVQADRAMALLKTLGYATVEYTGLDGESLYEKIYSPSESGVTELPVVIKLLDSGKTSLQDPPPPGITVESSAVLGAEGGINLPALDGSFLHSATTGEPQQRLLIGYDPDDLEPLERLANLLGEKIDVPARQVVLQALVIELQGDASKDLGVAWNTRGVAGEGDYRDDYDLTLGSENTVVDANSNRSTVLEPFTFIFNRTGVSDLLNFRAALQAKLQTTEAQILSSPSILVLDGRQAKIQIGNQIPVSSTVTGSQFSSSSFSYFGVGIVLNLRPRISRDGSEISLQVETIVSSVRSAVAQNQAPPVESRQVQTFVRVANDTPFIIGGLTSNDDTHSVTGVPILSNLPLLGPLFRRTVSDREKREVIIVITPHIAPAEDRNFSYVIPQETEIFDSFGHQLFYNSYRIRQRDVFDLGFLFESPAYVSLKSCAARYCEEAAGRSRVEPCASLLAGGIPGEEILIRRMLWEIVTKTKYHEFVDPAKVIFFEEVPGVPGESRLGFLNKSLPDVRGVDANALVLSYAARPLSTLEHPFVQPRALARQALLDPTGYHQELIAGNQRTESGEPGTWSVVLGTEHGLTRDPLDILRGVLVLKRLLELNASLPLTIQHFRPGRQVLFPTEGDITGSYHLIDPITARMFYEVASYYSAFEEEFKYQTSQMGEHLSACPEWRAALGLTATHLERAGDTVARRTHPSPAEAEASSGGLGAPESTADGVLDLAMPYAQERRPASVVAGRLTLPGRAELAPREAPTQAGAEQAPAGPTVTVVPSGVGREEMPRRTELSPRIAAEMATLETWLNADRGAGSGDLDRLYRLAVAAFEHGETADGYLALAQLYHALGRPYAALTTVRDAPMLEQSPQAHELMAEVYEGMGQTRKSKEHRARAEALSVDPGGDDPGAAHPARVSSLGRE